jgi:membrane protease subunit (stomatin/prohibitin family)
MAGRMTDASANAMETAAGNTAGAMTGFIGMGMAGGAMGGGFNAAQQFYATGVQQAAQAAAEGWKCSCGATATGKFCPECGAKKPEPQAAAGWTCSCGTQNTGKFCQNCGSKKPAGVPQYKCDKCGWQPADPTKAPKFCPECGDPFDNGDLV